jgi:hypothetical protein
MGFSTLNILNYRVIRRLCSSKSPLGGRADKVPWNVCISGGASPRAGMVISSLGKSTMAFGGIQAPIFKKNGGLLNNHSHIDRKYISFIIETMYFL